jgi:hypothetical protein
MRINLNKGKQRAWWELSHRMQHGSVAIRNGGTLVTSPWMPLHRYDDH